MGRLGAGGLRGCVRRAVDQVPGPRGVTFVEYPSGQVGTAKIAVGRLRIRWDSPNRDELPQRFRSSDADTSSSPGRLAIGLLSGTRRTPSQKTRQGCLGLSHDIAVGPLAGH
jgi:hypothetical protein